MYTGVLKTFLCIKNNNIIIIYTKKIIINIKSMHYLLRSKSNEYKAPIDTYFNSIFAPIFSVGIYTLNYILQFIISIYIHVYTKVYVKY